MNPLTPFWSLTARLSKRGKPGWLTEKENRMKTLAELIPQIALREVGVEEIDGTNCGPRVNEYKAATSLPADQEWPWCAAFVCWVIREAMRLAGGSYTFKRPTTASAWGMEGWSLAQDNSTQTKKPPQRDIQAGDIVVFRFSHIGIALSGPDAAGYIDTVEGNTDSAGSREGGGVFRKRRHVSKIRSRIRFGV